MITTLKINSFIHCKNFMNNIVHIPLIDLIKFYKLFLVIIHKKSIT